MMQGRGRRKRRIALLVSLLIHAALLTPLLLVAPRLRTDAPVSRRDVLLGLVPEAGLGMGVAPAPSLPGPDGAAGRRPVLPSAERPVSATATTAAALHPAGVAATSPSSGGGAAPAGAANAGDQAAVRRALQGALACAPGNLQNLDPDGRAACGKRLVEGAAAMGEAKVDTIPPLKRAYFDAVQKAYQDIRHYQTPDSTLTRLPGAASMYDQRVMAMPGRPPHTGCGLTFGGPKGASPAHAPPHSLFFKLGPVICGVTPPQGVLTEESATPNADDVP